MSSKYAAGVLLGGFGLWAVLYQVAALKTPRGSNKYCAYPTFTIFVRHSFFLLLSTWGFEFESRIKQNGHFSRSKSDGDDAGFRRGFHACYEWFQLTDSHHCAVDAGLAGKN